VTRTTLVVALAVLLVAGCTNDDGDAGANLPDEVEMTRFEDDRLAFDHPADWDIVDQGEGGEQHVHIEQPADDGGHPLGLVYAVWPLIPGDDLERTIGFFEPDPDTDAVTDLEEQDVEVAGATDVVLQTFVGRGDLGIFPAAASQEKDGENHRDDDLHPSRHPHGTSVALCARLCDAESVHARVRRGRARSFRVGQEGEGLVLPGRGLLGDGRLAPSPGGEVVVADRQRARPDVAAVEGLDQTRRMGLDVLPRTLGRRRDELGRQLPCGAGYGTGRRQPQ
jgi:hypothetical protein